MKPVDKISKKEIYEKVFQIFMKYKKRYKNPPKSKQIACMWSITNPPDIIEDTPPFIDIEKAFDISIDEDECLELYEMAFEMIEKELEPFQNEVFRLMELDMVQEAKLYCMGVLKGIYKYEHESNSEFKNWAVDIPGECFHDLLEKWKKRSKMKSDIKEMNEFVMMECRNWIK